MINPSASSGSKGIAQSIVSIKAQMEPLDAALLDADDYTVSKILQDGETMSSRLYEDFPYLYHRQGVLEDPDRLGMMIHLLA